MVSPPKKFIPPHKRDMLKKPMVQQLELALSARSPLGGKEKGEAGTGMQPSDNGMLIEPTVEEELQERSGAGEKVKRGKFKRVHRELSEEDKNRGVTLLGKKRGGDMKVVDEQQKEKRRRESSGVAEEHDNPSYAGLAD